MRSAANGESVLRPLAEELFRQIRMMGQLSWRNKADPRTNLHVRQRIRVTSSLFWLLQEHAGLRFEDGETVLLYNTERWPPDAPPAGRSSSSDGVLPVHMLTSYSAFWVGSGYEDNRPSVPRLLKAGGWLLMTTRDLTRVLEYLFALLRNGVVLDGDDVARAAGILLSRWRMATTDDELPQALFRGTPPRTAADLLDSDPIFAAALVPARPLPPEVLAAVVDIADAQIRRARAARNYEQWLIEHVVMGRVLRAVKALLQEHASPSPGLTALLDQYEEMYCDGGGIHVGATSSPAAYIRTYAGAFIKLFAFEGRLERLRTDRTILPDAIADELLAFRPLPPEWQHVSTSLAAVIGAVLLSGGVAQLTFHRSTPFSWQDSEGPQDEERLRLDARKELRALMDAVAAASAGERIARLSEAAALYPWFHSFQAQLAIAIDEEGDTARALPHVIDALLLDPGNAAYWQLLGMLLERLGRQDEVLPALAMADWLSSAQDEI